jgi:hypothetical protein
LPLTQIIMPAIIRLIRLFYNIKFELRFTRMTKTTIIKFKEFTLPLSSHSQSQLKYE